VRLHPAVAVRAFGERMPVLVTLTACLVAGWATAESPTTSQQSSNFESWAASIPISDGLVEASYSAAPPHLGIFRYGFDVQTRAFYRLHAGSIHFRSTDGVVYQGAENNNETLTPFQIQCGQEQVLDRVMGWPAFLHYRDHPTQPQSIDPTPDGGFQITLVPTKWYPRCPSLKVEKDPDLPYSQDVLAFQADGRLAGIRPMAAQKFSALSYVQDSSDPLIAQVASADADYPSTKLVEVRVYRGAEREARLAIFEPANMLRYARENSTGVGALLAVPGTAGKGAAGGTPERKPGDAFLDAVPSVTWTTKEKNPPPATPAEAGVAMTLPPDANSPYRKWRLPLFVLAGVFVIGAVVARMKRAA
jgi:hypothetical protein